MLQAIKAEHFRRIAGIRMIVLIARTIAIVWAGFWIVFFTAEVWAWNTPAPVAAIWIGIGLFFVLAAMVPWHYELSGGMLLVAVGLVVASAYVMWWPPQLPFATRVITTVAFAGPPLLAGLLFVVHSRERQLGPAR